MRLRDRAGNIHLLGAGEILRLEQDADNWVVERVLPDNSDVVLFRGTYADAKNARDGLWGAMKNGRKTYDFEQLENDADAKRGNIVKLHIVKPQPKPKPKPRGKSKPKPRAKSKSKPTPRGRKPRGKSRGK